MILKMQFIVLLPIILKYKLVKPQVPFQNPLIVYSVSNFKWALPILFLSLTKNISAEISFNLCFISFYLVKSQ